MASGHEVPGSRSGNSERCSRQYYLEEATDEDDVFAYVATLPTVLAGLPFVDFEYDEKEEVNDDDLHDYDITVNYGASKNPQEQDKDTLEYKFNFQAPGGHIKQSLATLATYEDETALPFGAPPFHGGINVVNDKGVTRVEGQAIQPPAEVFTLSYKVGNDAITGAYQLLVETLCGKVNSTTFRGRPAGSVMLSRASGGRDSSKDWHIEFGFGYIDNQTSIPVGANITVTSKDGFDLLWPYYAPVKDETTKTVNQNPIAAYIERVFYRADLNLLNLPS